MDFSDSLVYSSRIASTHAGSMAIATMRLRHSLAWLIPIGVLAATAAHPQDFKFSRPDSAEAAAEAARQDRVAQQLSTPCRADIKNKKIVVIIGERQSNGYIAAEQQNYGPHFQAINGRLRALGLTTYTPEEIRKQIAQAEIDAYFRNDPDAALAAARRLGASFVLRGLISTQASVNPVMPVNQVAVTMGFTLSRADGRVISDVDASSSSYAGADVARMALTLVNERADDVVATLYADYCSNAGLSARGQAVPK
jgi:hypothetical protein